jgi:hypothetical protein
MKISTLALATTLLIPVSGCEHLSSADKEKARGILEACAREMWTDGEKAGNLGIACRAMNDWMRQQGWHAQP